MSKNGLKFDLHYLFPYLCTFQLSFQVKKAKTIPLESLFQFKIPWLQIAGSETLSYIHRDGNLKIGLLRYFKVKYHENSFMCKNCNILYDGFCKWKVGGFMTLLFTNRYSIKDTCILSNF